MISFSKFLQTTFVIFICGITLTGCSVFMAVNGEREPDESVIKKDAHRTDIEVQLGTPIKVDTHPDGHVTAVYEYVIGTEPCIERAAIHGVADVMTLGLWEILASPIEYTKGEKVIVIISYDKEGYVTSATKSRKK